MWKTLGYENRIKRSKISNDDIWVLLYLKIILCFLARELGLSDDSFYFMRNLDLLQSIRKKNLWRTSLLYPGGGAYRTSKLRQIGTYGVHLRGFLVLAGLVGLENAKINIVPTGRNCPPPPSYTGSIGESVRLPHGQMKWKTPILNVGFSLKLTCRNTFRY